MATPVKALQPASLDRGVTRRRQRATLALTVIAVSAAAGGVLWLQESESRPEPSRTATTPPLDAPAAAAPAAPEPERPPASPETRNAVDGNEVWRRLALGDREGVLGLLRSARADGNTRLADRLANDVLSAVNKSVAQSRTTAAAAPGAASSDAYRLAEERLGSASRFEAARDSIRALGALWEASDLYVQALNDAGKSPPASSPASPAKPEPTTAVAGDAATPPPALPSSRAEVQSLPPESLARPGIPAAAERAPSTVQPRTPSDVDGVLAALDRYRSAYRARDASQVFQVFPSLSTGQIERLRRDFEGLAAYDVEIRDTRVEVQAEVATADAVVARRMTPRVGGTEVSNEVQTRFRLRRTDAGWVITGVTTQ